MGRWHFYQAFPRTTRLAPPGSHNPARTQAGCPGGAAPQAPKALEEEENDPKLCDPVAHVLRSIDR